MLLLVFNFKAALLNAAFTGSADGVLLLLISCAAVVADVTAVTAASVASVVAAATDATAIAAVVAAPYVADCAVVAVFAAVLGGAAVAADDDDSPCFCPPALQRQHQSFREWWSRWQHCRRDRQRFRIIPDIRLRNYFKVMWFGL